MVPYPAGRMEIALSGYKDLSLAIAETFLKTRVDFYLMWSLARDSRVPITLRSTVSTLLCNRHDALIHIWA